MTDIDKLLNTAPKYLFTNRYTKPLMEFIKKMHYSINDIKDSIKPDVYKDFGEIEALVDLENKALEWEYASDTNLHLYIASINSHAARHADTIVKIYQHIVGNKCRQQLVNGSSSWCRVNILNYADKTVEKGNWIED